MSVKLISNSDDIVLEATNVPAQKVLTELLKSPHVKVERAEAARDDALISGRFQGPLEYVLARVLEHEDSFVERAADGGVSRIVLYGASVDVPDAQRSAALDAAPAQKTEDGPAPPVVTPPKRSNNNAAIVKPGGVKQERLTKAISKISQHPSR